MRVELRGHHVDITPALRRLVDSKLARLERLLNDQAVSALAVLTREKHRHRTDITLHARGEKFLHGEAVSDNWETSVSEAIGKITQQAQKIKSKWQEWKRRGVGKAAPGVLAGAAQPESARPARAARPRARMPRIFRSERRALKIMSIADAAREIDGNLSGIVVFRDTETAGISVLYRRDGELTLVEMEAS